jgi:IclR family transcriptional regulator, pca regulon regulatory protein
MAGETLKTLSKALMILRAFDRASPELSVAEIARGVGESRTAVTRVLVTLERNGFVERNVQGLYRIGLAACEVGALYLIDNPLAKLADETLLQLARSTSGTAISAGSTAATSSSSEFARADIQSVSFGRPAIGCQSQRRRSEKPC